MIEKIIDKANSNQRAEKYVRRLLEKAPLSLIYKTFRKKDIKVNGHWIKKEQILMEGDVLRIYITDAQLEEFQKPREAIKSPLTYPIVYEDDKVLVVDKPAGLLVIGDDKETRNTLARKVLDYLYYKDEFDPNDHSFVPSPAHRLDRNTSGLVIFGKTNEALSELTFPFIGILTKRSQFSFTNLDIPLPSLPITITIFLFIQLFYPKNCIFYTVYHQAEGISSKNRIKIIK